MYVSRFQIDFKNKVSKTGYSWKGQRLIQNQDSGFEWHGYLHETYNHFISLAEHYKDTVSMKLEGLKFHNRWGKFTDRDNANDELDLMVAIHQYESIRFDLSVNKKPNLFGILDKTFVEKKGLYNASGSPAFDFHNIFGNIRMSYDWDGEGKNIVPTFYPSTLWEAIKLNLLLCGAESQKKIIECLYYTTYGIRKGCKKFTQGRKDKRFCSTGCRVGYYDKNKAQKK